MSVYINSSKTLCNDCIAKSKQFHTINEVHGPNFKKKWFEFFGRHYPLWMCSTCQQAVGQTMSKSQIQTADEAEYIELAEESSAEELTESEESEQSDKEEEYFYPRNLTAVYKKTENSYRCSLCSVSQGYLFFPALLQHLKSKHSEVIEEMQNDLSESRKSDAVGQTLRAAEVEEVNSQALAVHHDNYQATANPFIVLNANPQQSLGLNTAADQQLAVADSVNYATPMMLHDSNGALISACLPALEAQTSNSMTSLNQSANNHDLKSFSAICEQTNIHDSGSSQASIPWQVKTELHNSSPIAADLASNLGISASIQVKTELPNSSPIAANLALNFDTPAGIQVKTELPNSSPPTANFAFNLDTPASIQVQTELPNSSPIAADLALNLDIPAGIQVKTELPNSSPPAANLAFNLATPASIQVKTESAANFAFNPDIPANIQVKPELPDLALNFDTPSSIQLMHQATNQPNSNDSTAFCEEPILEIFKTETSLALNDAAAEAVALASSCQPTKQNSANKFQQSLRRSTRCRRLENNEKESAEFQKVYSQFATAANSLSLNNTSLAQQTFTMAANSLQLNNVRQPQQTFAAASNLLNPNNSRPFTMTAIPLSYVNVSQTAENTAAASETCAASIATAGKHLNLKTEALKDQKEARPTQQSYLVLNSDRATPQSFTTAANSLGVRTAEHTQQKLTTAACNSGSYFKIMVLDEEQQQQTTNLPKQTMAVVNAACQQITKSETPVEILPKIVSKQAKSQLTDAKKHNKSTANAKAASAGKLLMLIQFIKKIDNYYICRLCQVSQKYRTVHPARMHIKIDHYGYRYICGICNAAFRGRPDCHFKNMHPTSEYVCKFELPKMTVVDNGRPSKFLQFMKKLNNFYCCTLCKKSAKFSTYPKLRMHLKVQHFGYKYICQQCNMQFESIYLNNQHFRQIHKISPTQKMVMTSKNQAKQLELLKSNDKGSSATKHIFKYSQAYKQCGKSYSCKLCLKSRKFFQLASIRQHIEMQHFTRKYQCSQCAKLFGRTRKLDEHFAKQHDANCIPNFKMIWFKVAGKRDKPKGLIKKTGPTQFACGLCRESWHCDSKQAVRSHIRKQHCDLQYKCSQCIAYFRLKSELQQHLQKHSNPNKLVTNSHNSNFLKYLSEMDTLFQCSLCKNNYKNSNKLRTHIQRKHNDYRFFCRLCNAQFISKLAILKHLHKIHNIWPTDDVINVLQLTLLKNPEPMQKQATQAFVEYQQNDNSMDSSNAIKQEEIELTEYSISNSQNLNAMDIKAKGLQAGPKKNTFSFCKALKRYGNYYRCKLCLKSRKFHQVASLRRHIKFQHFAQKYKCSQCAVSFSSIKKLGQHCKRQHGNNVLGSIKKVWLRKTVKQIRIANLIKKIPFKSQYSCRLCKKSKSYKSIQTLRHHIKKQHCGFKFSCKQCKAIFRLKSKLQRHKHKTHSNAAQTKEVNPNEYIRKLDIYLSQCTICDKTSKDVNTLQVHIKIQHFGFRFFCSQCDAHYINKCTAMRHLRQKHNMTCTPERNNAIIIRRPEKERPPLERLSYAGFIQKVGAEYKCVKCVDLHSYASPVAVRQHIKNVHFGYRLMCNRCNIGYSSKQSIMRHLSTMHDTQEEDFTIENPAAKNAIEADQSTGIAEIEEQPTAVTFTIDEFMDAESSFKAEAEKLTAAYLPATSYSEQLALQSNDIKEENYFDEQEQHVSFVDNVGLM